jgi:hypothetical protein
VCAGYLWLAPAKEGAAAPAETLAVLRSTSAKPDPALPQALAARKESAGITLWMTSGFVKRSLAAAPPNPQLGPLLDGWSQVLAGLDLEEGGVKARAEVALRPAATPGLTAALGARNEVPPLRAQVDPRSALAVKLSLSLPELIRALGGLLGQAQTFNVLLAGLALVPGLNVKEGLIENLGDNYLLQARLAPGPLIADLAGSQRSGTAVQPWKWVQGSAAIQVRDPAALIRLLKTLTDRHLGLIHTERGGRSIWGVIGTPLPIYLTVQQGFALAATSEALLAQDADRVQNPKPAAARVPESFQQPDHQVVLLDARAAVEEIGKAQAAREDQADALAQAIVKMEVERLRPVDRAVLDLVVKPEALVVEVRIDLR